MVEVFTTNIKESIQAKKIISLLKSSYPNSKIHFDLTDSEFPFPCGHSILRVEELSVNSKDIISTINKSGFACQILEDRVCK